MAGERGWRCALYDGADVARIGVTVRSTGDARANDEKGDGRGWSGTRGMEGKFRP